MFRQAQSNILNAIQYIQNAYYTTVYYIVEIWGMWYGRRARGPKISLFFTWCKIDPNEIFQWR